ncbi:MAG: hypothetical protein HRU15_10880, partial [Planctomycetes bacterium]|nr:hypothetical protein [Planctomycetota bacterium]
GIEFLKDVMLQQQHRMRLNNIIILAMRIACILFLICALCRPQWISQQLAGGHIHRQGSCAALILIDDSASSHEQNTKLKALALEYLNTLRNGDEISIYSSSGSIHADPMYDLSAARNIIQKAHSHDTSCSIPKLLLLGLNNIRKHLNPEREIIIISDGQLQNWQKEAQQDWQNIEAQCKRSHIRLVHLFPQRQTLHNISLSNIHLQNHHFSVGQKSHVSIQVHSNKHVHGIDTLLRVRKDGRIIDERIIHCNADEQQSIPIPVEFHDSGSHYMSAELHGLHDAIQADNRRGISLVVNDHIPVLLVDAFSGEQTYYLQQALLSSNGETSIFSVEHSDIARLDQHDLDNYKVIVLTDIPALDHRNIAKLERYIVSGGSVLVCLGPHSEPESMNTYWVRNGDGFLPAYIKNTVTSGDVWFDVTSSAQQHPSLLALPQNDTIPFRHTIQQYYTLYNDQFESADDAATVLMEFPNGDPFLLERKRGEGRVLLCASSFDMQWGMLPHNPLFIPWVRGLCSYMASFLLPPRTIECGQSIVHPIKNLNSWHISNESHATIPCKIDRTQGRNILRSSPINKAGVYIAHTNTSQTYYVANINQVESDTNVISTNFLGQQLAQISTHVFLDASSISLAWNTKRGQDLALWRYFLFLSLLCLIAEISITHHVVMRERRLNIHGSAP